MNIVCVGDCGIDHYVASDERLPGGITANFSRHARHCFGAEDSIQVIAPIGDDGAAKVVEGCFDGSGIECRFTSLRGNTPVQSIALDASGERRFVGYAEGVLNQFRIAGKDADCIGNADLVVAPVFEQNRAMFASVMAVRRRGVTAVDFADFGEHASFELLNEYIAQIDIGFFGLGQNHEEIIDALRLCSAEQEALFVVTLGANGSLAFHNGNRFECAACPVERVVDTTGAGDAFAAGFLSAYCLLADINSALSTGAEVAAEVIQHRGAI